MKELSIKEKANRYNEALERSKGMYDKGMIPERIEYIFPELKESENERIRKAIINFLHEGNPFKNIKKETRQRWLAWLEKQGKQSSLNTNQDFLKGIKLIQEYQDLSNWEKEFDDIASRYVHNKNQEGYNNSWYVKERAAEMLYRAKKELEKQSEQKNADKVEPKF